MQGQLDEMRLERRPWLTMDVKIAGPLTFSPAPKIKLNVVLTNIGQSPAFNAWFNAILFPLTVGMDVTKEIPRRCEAARQDELRRQANPKQPGYTLFPGVHIEETRDVMMDEREFSENSIRGYIGIYALVFGDYLLSYSSPIHSTDMVFALAVDKERDYGRIRIILLPQNWSLTLNPALKQIDASDLHLYQEPFGYTYAD